MIIYICKYIKVNIHVYRRHENLSVSIYVHSYVQMYVYTYTNTHIFVQQAWECESFTACRTTCTCIYYMCVYKYINIDIRKFTCMHTTLEISRVSPPVSPLVYARIRIYIYVSIYICIYVYIYKYTCIYIYTYMYVYICIFMYQHKYIYVCIYMYVYVHTYMQQAWEFESLTAGRSTCSKSTADKVI